MYVVLTRNKDGNVILPGLEKSIENNYAPETRLLTSYCTVRVVRKKKRKEKTRMSSFPGRDEIRRKAFGPTHKPYGRYIGTPYRLSAPSGG